MERKYAEYAATKACELLAIDSPSGYTRKAADWVKEAFSSLGFDAQLTTKGGVLVNTARKEVIDEQGLIRAFEERADLKYITDIAAEAQPLLTEKFGKRVFATPKKMGAETAEANLNAGLAAARQTVDFLKNGNRRFQVNK